MSIFDVNEQILNNRTWIFDVNLPPQQPVQSIKYVIFICRITKCKFLHRSHISNQILPQDSAEIATNLIL